MSKPLWATSDPETYETRHLRSAIEAAGIDPPREGDLEGLGLCFSAAGLDPNRFAGSSALTETEKEDLRHHADDLRSQLASSYASVTPPDPGEPVGSGGGNGTPAMPEAQAKARWETIRDSYEDGDKKEARLDAALLLRDRHIVRTKEQNGHIYVWDENRKVYQDNGVTALEEDLCQGLGIYWTRHEQKEIFARLRQITYRDDIGEHAVIPVGGADLTLDPLEASEPTHERLVTSRSAADWDPTAEPELFFEYLWEVVPDIDHQETLQEFAGYSLMHWALPYHKALFLVGPTASGKSTFLNIIHDLCGSVTTVGPHQLIDSRFNAIELEGSWANVRSDIPSKMMQNIGFFKEIVAGDPIYVERKYEQGYRLEPKTKHFYSANRLPSLNVDDDAFFRRVLLVPFPRKIPRDERDEHLKGKLRGELDGILQWAVQGLERLLDQGGFSHDLDPKATRSMWEQFASSIGRFKALCLDVTGKKEHFVPKQRVYSRYTDFCEEEGLSVESQQEFTSMLKQDPKITDGKRTPAGESSQVRCYQGVVLDEAENESNSDEEIPF